MIKTNSEQTNTNHTSVGAALLNLLGKYLTYNSELDKLAGEAPPEVAIPKIMEESTVLIPEDLSLDERMTLCDVEFDDSNLKAERIYVYTIDRTKILADGTIYIESDSLINIKPVGLGERSKSYILPDGYGVRDLEIELLCHVFVRSRDELRLIRVGSPLYNILCRQKSLAESWAHGMPENSSEFIKYQKLLNIINALEKNEK